MTLGVRPEHAQPVPSGGDIDGEIAVVERLGSHTQLGIRLADGSMLVSTADSVGAVRVGDRRRIGFDRAGLHLFRADGGAFDRILIPGAVMH